MLIGQIEAEGVESRLRAQAAEQLTGQGDFGVRRSEHTLRLLHPAGWSYFDTLRKKLHWNEGGV